jgi:hypothetical protein
MTILIISVPIELGWIKNLSDLVTQVVAGAVIVVAGAAVGFWFKSGSGNKVKESVPSRVVFDNRYSESSEYIGNEVHGNFDKILDNRHAKGTKVKDFKVFDGDQDENR